MNGGRLLFGAAVLAAAGQAAASWDTQREPRFSWLSPASLQVQPGSSSSTAMSPRTYANLGNGLNALRDPARFPSPAGLTTGTLTRPFPWRSVGMALGRTIPPITGALAVAQLLNEVRCQIDGNAWECDPGQPRVEQGQWCTNAFVGPQVCVGSVAEAEARHLQYQSQGQCYAAIGTSTVGATSLATRVRHTPWAPCTDANSSTSTINWTKVTLLVCPGSTIIIRGTVLCSTEPATWPVASPQTVEDAVAVRGDPARAPQVVPELAERAVPIPHDTPISAPDPTPWVRDETRNPDGSITVRDRRYEGTPAGSDVSWREITREQTYPPNTAPPPVGQLPGDSPGSSVTPTEREITCGLPGTPPCKIDESGTPSSAPELPNAATEWLPALQEIQAPRAANTAWSFTFQFPTGCQAIVIGPWAGQEVRVDVCQFQPMIHELVSILWIISGIILALRMAYTTLSGS